MGRLRRYLLFFLVVAAALAVSCKFPHKGANPKGSAPEAGVNDPASLGGAEFDAEEVGEWPSSLLDDDVADVDPESSASFGVRGKTPSEMAAWIARFASFANPQMPVPFNDDYKLWTRNQPIDVIESMARMVMRCAENHSVWKDSFAKAKAQDPEDYEALIYSIRGYIGIASLYDTYVVPEANDWDHFPVRDPSTGKTTVRQLRCDAAEWQNSSTKYYLAAFLKRAPFLRDFEPGYTGPINLKNFLDRMKNNPGATIEDIFHAYLHFTFQVAFRFNDQAFVADYYPAGASPYEVFINKTTPSLAANEKIATELAKFISWNELGMYHYNSWGYGWLQSWMGQFQYEHPVLNSLIPFYGAAMDALDAFESARTGVDAYGRPQARALSVGLVALNVSFALLDLPDVKAFGSTAYKGMRALVKRARGAKTVEDLAPIIEEAQDLLQKATVDTGTEIVKVGEKAREAAIALGHPTTRSKRFWNRVLGFAEAPSKIYSRKMASYVAKAARYAISAVTDPNKTYLEMLSMIANGAADIAGNPIFGQMRPFKEPLYFHGTPVKGKYAVFLPMFRRFAERGERLNPFEFFQKYTIRPDLVGKVGFVNQMFGKLKLGDFLVDVPLNLIVVYDVPDAGNIAGWMVHWTDGFLKPFRGFNSAEEIFEAVTAHQETLFRQVLDPKTSRPEALKLIAQIHWWEANLVRYYRGSNGISQAMAAALAKARGIHLGQLHKTVSVDMWAFTHSIEEFVEAYPSLFDKLDDSLPLDFTVPGTKVPPPPPPPVPPLNTLLKYPAELQPSLGTTALDGKLTEIKPVAPGSNELRLRGWMVTKSFVVGREIADDELFGGTPGLGESKENFDTTLYAQVTMVPEGGGEEEEILTWDVAEPSPADLPANYVALKKVTAGFDKTITTDPCGTYRLYAVHPVLLHVKRLVEEFHGKNYPCEGTPTPTPSSSPSPTRSPSPSPTPSPSPSYSPPLYCPYDAPLVRYCCQKYGDGTPQFRCCADAKQCSSPSPWPSQSPSPSPSFSPSSSPSSSSSPSPWPSASPSWMPSASPSSLPSGSPSATPSSSPVSSATPNPCTSPTPTFSATPSASSALYTPITNSAYSTTSPSPSGTPSPSWTPSPSASTTPCPSPSSSPSYSVSPSASPSCAPGEILYCTDGYPGTCYCSSGGVVK